MKEYGRLHDYISTIYMPSLNEDRIKVGCIIEVEENDKKRKGIVVYAFSKTETKELKMFGCLIKAKMFDTNKVEEFYYDYELVKYPSDDELEQVFKNNQFIMEQE